MAKDIIADMRLGGRTKSYRWMWDHFDELSVSRLHWETVARTLTALGCGPISAEAARKTFDRVKKDKAADNVGVKETLEVSPQKASGPFFGPDSPVTPIEPDDGDGFKLKRG